MANIPAFQASDESSILSARTKISPVLGFYFSQNYVRFTTINCFDNNFFVVYAATHKTRQNQKIRGFERLVVDFVGSQWRGLRWICGIF